MPPSIIAQDLIDTYKEKGFWNVSVSAQVEDDRLFFIINEGNRAIIKKIIIKGIRYFDPQKCIDTYFDTILSACSFDSGMLKNATNELIDQYNKNGFFDAKIICQNIIPLNEPSQCSLELGIEEGSQYVLKKIVIEQFPELVHKCPGADLGAPCTAQLLESQKKWLQNQLNEKGFSDALLALELIREKNAVIVSWHIELKHVHAQFGKTVVIGNGDLPANYLLRELVYKPGDPFNLDRVRQSLKKLRSLDLFDSISLVPDSSCPLACGHR